MANDEQSIQFSTCADGTVGWRSYPYHLSAGLLHDERAGAVRLTVEQTEDGLWEWLAWSAFDPGHCLHGRVATRCEARQAAEQAARGLVQIVGAQHRPDLPVSLGAHRAN